MKSILSAAKILGTAFLAMVLAVSAAYLILRNHRMSVQTARADEIRKLGRSIDVQVVERLRGAALATAGAQWVLRTASGGAGVDPPEALLILETTRTNFNAAIVYIMNRAGDVVACTPYEETKTLTGNNYAFRPYFLQAMKGKSFLYPALGVTTFERGIYTSAPVPHPAHEPPEGVFVIKSGLDPIDHLLADIRDPAALVSPEGVVFAANRPEWLFHLIRPISEPEKNRLRESRQFADRPLENLPEGWDLSGDFATVSGARYGVFRAAVGIIGSDGRPWEVVSVSDLDASLPVPFMAGVITAITIISVFLSLYLSDLRKRSALERENSANREFLATTLNSIGDAVIAADVSGRVRHMNPAAERLTGWSVAEAVGVLLPRVLDLMSQKAGEPSQGITGRILETGDAEPSFDNLWLRSKAGAMRRAAVSIAPIRDGMGNSAGGVWVVSDITRRKQAEESLWETEIRYRQLFENSPLGVFRTSLEGEALAVNTEMAKIVGCASPEEARAEFKDLSRQLYVDPNRRKEFIRLLQARGKVTHFEYQARRKDGRIIWISMNARLVTDDVSGKPVIDGFASDISEIKRTEEALRQRIIALTMPVDDPEGLQFTDLFNIEDIQRIQDDFADATGVASIITHPDGKPITRPSNFCRLCSDIIRKTEKGLANCFRSDAVLGRQNLSGPVVQPCLSGGLWDAGASISVGGRHLANWLIGQVRNEAQDEEAMLRYADVIGADRDAFGKALAEVPVMSKDQFGKVARALFSFANELSMKAYQNAQQARFIAERDRAAEEARRLAEAVRQASEAVVITDPEGVMEYVNPAFERITGFSSEEAVGRTPRILKSGQQDDAFYKTLWDTILSGNQWTGRMVNKRRDGALYVDECTISPIKNVRGEIERFVAVKRDISKELEFEERFRQTERLESVGRLAAGVAHDLNNLLSPVLGYSEMVLLDLDPSQKAFRQIQTIKESAERARDLIRQLLAFGRKQLLEIRVLDLRRTVGDMEKLLRRTIRENIALETFYSPEACTVSADPGQMGQVLMNLAVNAQDAMPGGGSLTVEVFPSRLDDAYCRRHTGVAPGNYVTLAVSDTGFGMDAETRQHIFEPFFTTKKEMGTGLGLATVYGIVKQHGGNIWVYSEPGQGTAFKVYLPAAGEDAAASEDKQSPVRDFRGDETILVVEDNDMARDLVCEMLERHGYAVVSAVSGNDALRRLKDHPGSVHLLLTDVIMPDMDGGSLATELSQAYPGVRVIFMSGYTQNVIAHHGVLEPGVNFIQKPFSSTSLAEKVRQVLDGG